MSTVQTEEKSDFLLLALFLGAQTMSLSQSRRTFCKSVAASSAAAILVQPAHASPKIYQPYPGYVAGKLIVITGASSGLGIGQLAGCG